MDQLDSNSYINYFGKCESIERMDIKPIVLIKGSTKVALYGVGHLPDTRLNLMLESNNLTFERPCKLDSDEIDDEFFYILVMHQNRYKGMYSHGTRTSI